MRAQSTPSYRRRRRCTKVNGACAPKQPKVSSLDGRGQLVEVQCRRIQASRRKRAATSPIYEPSLQRGFRNSGSRDGAAEVQNNFRDRAASGQDKPACPQVAQQEDRVAEKSPKSTHRNREGISRQRGMSSHRGSSVHPALTQKASQKQLSERLALPFYKSPTSEQ